MQPSYKFNKYSIVFLMGMLSFPVAGNSKSVDGNQSPLEGYSISTNVQTTRQRTVVLDPPTPFETVLPYEISKYAANGYGNWHYGYGIDSGKRLDIMPIGYSAASVTNTARLLNFFTITDAHIDDKETPCQAIYSGYTGGNSSAYSPVMLYTTQVLDAAVQTINALHKQKPFDFGIALGDATNGSQYNELRWYIDVLDGKNINPDSGDKDDPVPGPYNDYQDEYKAAGLDTTIPWYQTIGNHDHFWMGSYPVTDYLRPIYTGMDILLMGDLFTDGPDSRVAYLGAIDGRTPHGDIIGVGLVGDFTTAPTVLAADTNRRPLSTKEWISEFFNTSSNPVGHGFSQSNVTTGFACYTFEPKLNMPIKVIVLDDTQVDENYNMHGQGYLDQERFDWLITQLDQGQAEGKLMIISAHIPISLIGYGYTTTNSCISTATLLAKLSTYPNLMLWVAGHRHRNVVTPRPSIDTAYSGAEYGFWEVETASLRDFPQQFRTFEIFRNSDTTISIIATDVDPAVQDGSLAAISRSYGIAAQQLFNYNIVPPAGAFPYNAELIKQLSPDMQDIIQNYGTPIGPTWVSNFYLYN